MEFQGFQSAYSTSIIFFVAIILVALAFYSYRNQKSLSPAVKVLLGSIRAVAFLVVLVLVLNPFFFSSEEQVQNPKILMLLDDSESTSILRGSYEGLESYEQVLKKVANTEDAQLEVDYFTIGSGTTQIQSIDSLTFNQPASNFIEAITQIVESEDDYAATVMISDGIITIGRNPLITASGLSIPIHTIGIGDTSIVRDITINNVVTNATGYTNTRQVVEIEIAQNGYQNENTQVRILDASNNLISEENVTFTSSESVTTVTTEIELIEEGLVSYKVDVLPLNEEWSVLNNSRNFTIDVLDSKTRIVHISSEIHPDIKFIRSLLSTDPSIELTTLTWLGGNNFVEEFPENFEEFDLMILHGIPPQNPIIANTELLSSSPTFYIELPKTRRRLNADFTFKLINNFGMQVFEMSLFPSNSIESHPILEYDEVSYQALAPILTSLRTELLVPDAIPLMNIGFQGIETPNPLMAISERGGIRRVHVAAWGWYTLFQSPSESEREFVSQLFLNIVNWASNNPDNRLLKVSPTQNSFGSNEQVIINASLINESGNPESEASIELHIYSQEDEERVFNLNNLGSGNYSLSFDALNTGIYSFTATARKDSRIIDEQSGEFVVEDSNLELINTSRNDELLIALANETGGTFTSFENVSEFWSNLREQTPLTQQTIEIESYHFPVRSFYWFILVLALLATEWVLRKNFSLP